VNTRACILALVAVGLAAPVSAQTTIMPGRNWIYRIDGSATQPTNTYEGDRDLGSYRIGADNEGFTAGGALRFDYNATRLKLASSYRLDWNTTQIDETDIAKIDGITNGTTTASKALVTDANGAMSILRTASLRLGTSGSETTVTSTGAELNYLAGVTCGTVTASKALCVDANKDLASVRHLTATGNLIGGGAVVAGSGNVIGWAGGAQMVSNTTNKIVMYGNALSAISMVQFGGVSASHVGFKFVGTDTQFRTASDGAYTAVDAGAYKLNGSAVSFPATCSNTSVSSTITATSSETAFDLNCPLTANSLVAGQILSVYFSGIYNGNASDTVTFKLKICQVAGCGSGTAVTLATTSAITLGAVTNQAWKLQSRINAFTIGASGTLDAQTEGYVASTGLAQTPFAVPSTATSTVNTTVTEYLTLTAQFSSNNASNSITMRNLGILVQ
jgi:hypothetical protein